MVLPAFSLKFANAWGTVTNLNPANGLPIDVKFSPTGRSYKFDYNELVTKHDYEQRKYDQVLCQVCGRDLSGQFIDTCSACEDQMFEEDIQQWQK